MFAISAASDRPWPGCIKAVYIVSLCKARRFRRREKLDLAQRLLWVRAKYRACVIQQVTANEGRDVST